MKRNTPWNLAIVFTIAIALTSIMLMILPGQTQAQGGGIGAQAVPGTAFTYQGQLMYNGSPISGTCSLAFKLYDASSGGNQVGSTVTDGSVSVSNGYFNANLDFGSNAFAGEARWLGITINSCPGGASGVTLSPRVALNPAPYAFSLRPGAVISGAVASGSGLKVVNSSAGDTASGILGQSNSTQGNGIFGWATAGSGATSGVYGRSDSTQGSGIYGQATAGSGATSGVYGQSDSPNGYGVRGLAFAGSGTAYGVYGQSNSSSGYGVYSNGNAHVEGQLTWKPITGHVSIPSASFRPEGSGATYIGSAGWLQNTTIVPAGNAYYAAGVQLPDGATITKLTFYWNDTSASYDGTVSLQRNTFDMSAQEIGAASTSGAAGNGNSSDTSLFHTLVDNTQYAYLLRAQLPNGNKPIYLQGAVIEYTINRPY